MKKRRRKRGCLGVPFEAALRLCREHARKVRWEMEKTGKAERGRHWNRLKRDGMRDFP